VIGVPGAGRAGPDVQAIMVKAMQALRKKLSGDLHQAIVFIRPPAGSLMRYRP
jgi:hypothetical protein